jgi:hypothetical protein
MQNVIRKRARAREPRSVERRALDQNVSTKKYKFAWAKIVSLSMIFDGSRRIFGSRYAMVFVCFHR